MRPLLSEVGISEKLVQDNAIFAGVGTACSYKYQGIPDSAAKKLVLLRLKWSKIVTGTLYDASETALNQYFSGCRTGSKKHTQKQE